MNAFLLALSFLTRIPVHSELNYEAVEMARSVLWYPVIGLLIGMLLLVVFSALSFLHLSTFLIAAILLAVWILITGALHWDGLADSADAWLAGGDKEKTLLILKDTHCGAAAIVVVGVSLIISCAALQSVIEQEKIMVLLLSPLLARSAAILVLMVMPYVREGGLGQLMILHFSRIKIVVVLLIVLCMAVWLLQWQSLIVLGGLSIFVWLLCQLMYKRIGGVTGDTIGALIVLTEMMVMVLSVVSI